MREPHVYNVAFSYIRQIETIRVVAVAGPSGHVTQHDKNVRT